LLKEGITDRVYLDGKDKETEIDYKISNVELSCYDKTDSELQGVFGWVYFNGGIYDKDEIINLELTQMQKSNSNNVYYNDYFVFSAYEYEDIRFERNIFINTENYVIIVLIRILNSDFRNRMIRNNSQYFKMVGSKVGLVEYNEDLLIVPDSGFPEFWPCWDHGNNATRLFLENINNNINGLSNDVVLWIRETEEIINSIKLE
jgi:hypothetical protein